MVPGSRFACPGRRWGLLYFGVIASPSEAIHVSASRIRRMDCFVAFASLRKRFAFVAAKTSVSFLRKQEPITTAVCVGLNRRTSARNLDVGGNGSRIALRLSGTTVGVALFRRHCERQQGNPRFGIANSQNGLLRRFRFLAQALRVCRSQNIGVVPAKAGTHNHGYLCRTEPLHQRPQLDVGVMVPGSRFACPGRRWGLLYFGVIASPSEAIHVSASRIRRMDCFVAFASLRKRFAFVAAKTSVSFLRKQEPITTAVCVGLNRRTSARNLDVGGNGSRIALRLSGTTVGVALFRRHCERQQGNPRFGIANSQNGLLRRFRFLAQALRVCRSQNIGVVPAKAGTHNHGYLCRTEPLHQRPQLDVGVMVPGSRFACPGRRWGLLYFGVIASPSEAIHVSASRIRRMDCFVAFASLRKRFAFVAAKTSVSFLRKQEPITTAVCVGLN